MESQAVLRHSPEILRVDLVEGPVLLHSGRWEYLEFDKVGGVLWEMFTEPRTLDSVVPLLLERYATDAETCRADSEVFIQKLLTAGFLLEQA